MPPVPLLDPRATVTSVLLVWLDPRLRVAMVVVCRHQAVSGWSIDAARTAQTTTKSNLSARPLSTRSQLADSQIRNSDNIMSISLACKFIATNAGRSILFFDRTIIPAEDLTGNCNVVRDLSNILPDLYRLFHPSICALMVLACRITLAR